MQFRELKVSRHLSQTRRFCLWPLRNDPDDCSETCGSPSAQSGYYELRGEAARTLSSQVQRLGVEGWPLCAIKLDRCLCFGFARTRYFVSTSCEASGAPANIVPWIDAEDGSARPQLRSPSRLSSQLGESSEAMPRRVARVWAASEVNDRCDLESAHLGIVAFERILSTAPLWQCS